MFTHVTVTRDYDFADGVDPGGYVTFQPTTPIVNDGVTVVASARRADLDVDGQISIPLAANTDPDTIPSGSAYQVVEKITGQQTRTYYVVIPHDGPPTLDLSELDELTAPPFPEPAELSALLATKLDAESVRDTIAAALVAGTGISVVHNDPSNTITVTATGAYSDENARDAIGTALVGAGNITVTPNDGADTITVDGTALMPKTGGGFTGKVGFGGAASSTAEIASYGSIAVRDSTPPGTNPSNGLFVYAESGVLKARDSAGTIHVLTDADLTSIAGLSAANDDLIQRKSGAWTNRTLTQFAADLGPLLPSAGVALPNPGAGQYFYTISPGGSSQTQLSHQTLRLAPWIVDSDLTIDRIGFLVGTSGAGQSGAKYRVGIYADNGQCYPGSLLLDAGQGAADAIGTVAMTVSLTLEPGLYWVGGVPQLAATTLPFIGTAGSSWTPPVSPGLGTSPPDTVFGCFTQASVSGALPSTFTSTRSVAATAPRLFVRAA